MDPDSVLEEVTWESQVSSVDKVTKGPTHTAVTCLPCLVIVQTSPIVDALTKQKPLFCARKGVPIPCEKGLVCSTVC